MHRHRIVLCGVLPACVLGTFVLAVVVGSVDLPAGQVVRAALGMDADQRIAVLVQAIRVPRAVTGALCGAGLGVAGLLTQTIFRNALAEPYVLGVSSGAGLGVAIYVSAGTSTFAVAGVAAMGGSASRVGAVGAAAIGAVVMLAIVLGLSRLARSTTTLLIVGVMLGALVSAVVGIILAWTSPQAAQQYLIWGLGSVDGVSRTDLPIFAAVVLVGIIGAAVMAKPLDALLLGDDYATTSGVAVRRARMCALLVAAVLAAAVTAYCGPVGFIGIAVPHIARVIVGSSAHRYLLPAAALVGACVGLCATIVAHPPGAGITIPLNVVTSLIGAPVVIVVLLRSARFAAGFR